MQNLNLKVNVPADRKVQLQLQLPDDVDPGEAELIVIIRSRRRKTSPESSLLSRLPNLHVDHWPADSTFSRSEIYGDDGR